MRQIFLSLLAAACLFAQGRRDRATDEGPVDPGFSMPGLVLYLKAPAAQQRLLGQFLNELRNPASPNYRKFLTPEQYAERFGVPPEDLDRVRSWLESQGFTVKAVARGSTFMVFDGTAAQVTAAFGTQIHRYRAPDRLHYANARSVSLPAALADVVLGASGMDDFGAQSELVRRTIAPDFTTGSGAHVLAPDDIATIYDIAPLYKAGIDGTGLTIAVVGQSRMSASDVAAFRTRFKLPDRPPRAVLVPNTTDPGFTADLIETNLDLQWAGAVARNANLVYVYASDAGTALAYAINQNLAPIVSSSYSFGCEARIAPATLTFFQQLAQQAAAQGITWVTSAGDGGAAGCDTNAYPVAQNGLAARFPATVPEVTAVGGTQLDEQAGPGPYWNAQNDVNGASAVSYIPERVWNETPAFGGLEAGAGGVSIVFPKPPWQTGAGVPNDGFRDIPDISLAAGVREGYLTYTSGSLAVVGGTSGAAPVFAGMLALLNQFLVATGVHSSPGLGNINPELYRLAQDSPSVFHDITAGNNSVPCAASSPSCSQGSFGYAAGPGYDLASGLGTPDLNNLVHQWSTQTPKDSQVVISLSKNPVYQQAPDRTGSRWTLGLTLTEEEGTSTTLTDFTINGTSGLSTFFPRTALGAYQQLSAGVGFPSLNVPTTVTFGFAGQDASGRQWSQQVSVPFLGLPPLPSIDGISNAFSGTQAYAPGMILAVYGTNLGAALQLAAVTPLESYLGGFAASIDGFPCPLYYVSPNQVDLQIPYEVKPGPTSLVVSNAVGTATFPLQVTPSAPGISAALSSGGRGQISTMYITGEGNVTPAVKTGSTPSNGSVPMPNLSVSLTVGGVDAPIQFIGIPSWSVGVTQINFQVPQTAPLGPQPVVVTVGGVASTAATFTVMP